MSSKNKWKQPVQPPPPLFLGKKERDLVKQVNDELIERVIGQQILYYAIDYNITNFNSVYGEAIEKNFHPPLKVHALVEWEALETNYSNNIGMDKKNNINVHFFKRRINEDYDLIVREGDFVYFGDSFYEIAEIAQPKLLFGQPDHKVEVMARCIVSREGLFDAS